MALAPVRLDDLTFEEMARSVRDKIAGASGGEWTLHAAVDPGVTLLELFAWQIEQRIYWLDQVPDDLVRALLSLLGEAPLPARPATTVLTLADGKASRFFLDVAAGFELTLRDREPETTFSLRQGLTIAPVAGVTVVTADGESPAVQPAGSWLPLLPADGSPGEFRIRLAFQDPMPTPPPLEPLSLLFAFDSEAVPASQWRRAAPATVRPPAKIVWWYEVAAAAPARFPDRAVEDGTGGLRRSGIVRLPIPELAGLAPADRKDLSIIGRVESTSFSAPPRLTRVVVNAALAEHTKSVSAALSALEAQAQNWLRLPGQTLELEAAEPPPLAPTVELDVTEATGPESWTGVADFAYGGPADRMFTVDRELRLLRFGDGLTGRIPVPDMLTPSPLEVRYRAGGGDAGNLGSDLVWEAAADRDVGGRNVVAATEGEDPETPLQAAQRAAEGLIERERAITAPDFEGLASTTPGLAIARAHAAIGHHPLHSCSAVPGVVTVFVVPDVPRPEPAGWSWPDPARVEAPIADSGALAEIAQRLDRRRLVTTEVFVLAAAYRRVSLEVRVASDPADRVQLRGNVAAALSRYLDPLVGGDSGTGWPFGDPVRPSALVRVTQDAIGREGEVTGVQVGLDDGSPDEGCSDLEIRSYELVVLDSLTVTIEPPSARRGGLR